MDNEIAPSESTAEPPGDVAVNLYPDDQPAPANDTPAQPVETEPEPYRLTLPEGVTVDQELLGAATPVFRELGLDDEQASKLAPLAVQVEQRVISGLNDEYVALRTDWAKQSRADPHLGGERWPETQRLLAVALDAAGAPRGCEFRKVMDQSGLGDHPAVIRVFRRLGEQILAANGGKPPQRSALENLYPNDVR